MQALKEVFPIITTPEWLERREQAWNLLLTEGDFKKDYRKKDLEKIRKYFFEGEMLGDSPIKKYTGMWVYMFPLQTVEGYDYFYLNYKYSIDDLMDFNTGIFHDCSIYGMLPEDQLAYWDYHVGIEYQPIVMRKISGGEVDLKVEPLKYFFNILYAINSFMEKPSYSLQPKWIVRLDYFFSLLKHMYENELEISDESVRAFRMLCSKIYNKKFGEKLTEVSEFHLKFCDDFVSCISVFPYLPSKFQEVWDEIARK